jgi:hypothetical protein
MKPFGIRVVETPVRPAALRALLMVARDSPEGCTNPGSCRGQIVLVQHSTQKIVSADVGARRGGKGPQAALSLGGGQPSPRFSRPVARTARCRSGRSGDPGRSGRANDGPNEGRGPRRGRLLWCPGPGRPAGRSALALRPRCQSCRAQELHPPSFPCARACERLPSGQGRKGVQHDQVGGAGDRGMVHVQSGPDRRESMPASAVDRAATPDATPQAAGRRPPVLDSRVSLGSPMARVPARRSARDRARLASPGVDGLLALAVPTTPGSRAPAHRG